MIDIGQLKTADIKALLEQNPDDVMALLQTMKEDRRLSVQKLADTYIRRKMKEEAERERVMHMYSLETAYYNDGIYHVAGIDEAGRAPWPGRSW